VPLTVVGRVLENSKRLFTGEGAILLPDGAIAATATGKYMKLKLERIADFDAAGETWESYPRETDPEWIEVPEE
jgi:hypothetical protein